MVMIDLNKLFRFYLDHYQMCDSVRFQPRN